ncbi:hypothetical protein ACFLW8_04360 [Chloroflexota bacterium]
MEFVIEYWPSILRMLVEPWFPFVALLIGLVLLYFALRVPQQQVEGSQYLGDEIQTKSYDMRDVFANPPDEKEFVSVTPDDLMNFFSADQTSIQSRRVVDPFIGKWIKVEGDLGDVLAVGSDGAGVTFANYRFTGDMARYKKLSMYFMGKKWVERLYILKKGTRIAVQGQIKYVFELGVELENCELIQ